MKTLCHRELKRVFDYYNARYFDGKLPSDTDVMFAPTENCIGIAEVDHGGFIVTIDPKYAIEGRTWRLTLLHEMVHLKLYPARTHGNTFQQQMFRLAILGAFRQLW